MAKKIKPDLIDEALNDRDVFIDEMKALQDKYNVELIPVPFIDNQGRIGAEVRVVTKVANGNIITQDTIIQDAH